MEIPNPTPPPESSIPPIRSSVGARRLSTEPPAASEELGHVSPKDAEIVGGVTTGATVEAPYASRVHSSVGRRSVGRRESPELEPASRVRSSVGGHKSPLVPSDTSLTIRDTIDVSSEKRLPTLDSLRPEVKKVKTYMDKAGSIDLRLSSSGDHQDGLAYNPDTDTVVVCDGMGGFGKQGDVKNYFGFALAHAVAEIDDISELSDPETIDAIVSRAKSILVNELGVNNIEGGLTRMSLRPIEWGSTIAATQRIPDTNRWRVVTIGDSSVAILDKTGKIRQGFGEAFQLIAKGDVESNGCASDPPLGSYVGMAKDSLEGYVQYSGSRGTQAEFTEIELGEGEKIVVVSDAYVQKTPLRVLEADAALTSEEWASKKPLYSDDTTMAIIS